MGVGLGGVRSCEGGGGGADDFFGGVPEKVVVFGLGDVLVVAGEARQDAHDVAIDDGGGDVEGDAGDGAGGVAADAGEIAELVEGGGDLARVIGDDLLGG